MRFATRILLLQLALVVAVVTVCTAVFLFLGVQQLRAESESSALNIARTLAEDPDVRALVTEFSADTGTPDSAQLRNGELQVLAAAVADRTDALFVVITDDHGIRLAHPNEDLLGQIVSTPFEDVLAGNEVVDWERGTLGESARAKVPVFPPAGGEPVGEVSVGFERASVFDDLPVLLGSIGLAALGALALAALATMLMRRRWERVTLGLQPEDLVALVQNQAAVLDGVGDGVVALDGDGIVRVCNAAAARMLGVTDPIGRALSDLGLPPGLVLAANDGRARDGLAWGDRILYLDAHPVQRDGRDLGEIIIVRDRTDVVALSQRLDTVRAMTGALRVQRHEFANRMHVATGLIDAGRVPDAREFLAEQLQRSPVDVRIDGIELVADPFLQAFLGAKAIELAERGIRLGIGDDTLVLGLVSEVEDVATIVGNLIDNAATAASAGDASAWVDVGFLTDGAELVLTVSDSGGGLAPDADVFVGRSADAIPADAIHGLGIGLPLSRDLARRRGGEVWVIDPGGNGTGAVFGARLPGVIRAERGGTP